MVSLLPLVVTAALTPAQADPTTAWGHEPIGPERRILDTCSRDTWTVVQKRLKELGLEVDKIDNDSQVILTKWQHVPGRTAGWLPPLQLPEPYIADRLRFEVFVSPFIEPARLYVGSQVEAVGPRSPAGRPRATVYNKKAANQALIADLLHSLAGANLPRFAQNAADPCSEQVRARGPGIRTDPKKIPLSVFPVEYPGPEDKGGRVIVEYVVLEDGGVASVRIMNPPADSVLGFSRAGEQSQAAAMGAASLSLWAPARVDGCPIRIIVTEVVNLRPR
jgi:hypothetical protein